MKKNSVSVKGRGARGVGTSGTPTPSTSKRSDAVANHARILEAATAAFMEKGLTMEIADIAAQAGLGAGTLYRHFDNRDAILRAVVERIIVEALAQLRVVADYEDPRAALRAVPHLIAQVHGRFPPLLALIGDPRLARIVAEDPLPPEAMPEGIVTLLEGVLERGARAGVFRDDVAPRTMAAAVLGSIAATLGLRDPGRSATELAGELAILHAGMVMPPLPKAGPATGPLEI